MIRTIGVLALLALRHSSRIFQGTLLTCQLDLIFHLKYFYLNLHSAACSLGLLPRGQGRSPTQPYLEFEAGRRRWRPATVPLDCLRPPAFLFLCVVVLRVCFKIIDVLVCCFGWTCCLRVCLLSRTGVSHSSSAWEAVTVPLTGV